MFNHLGQCVTDIERATRFYVELFGFTVERELHIPDEGAAPLLAIEPPVGLFARYLRLGEFVLELMTFDRPANPERRPRVMNEPGLTHISLSVEDFDAVVDRVPEFGGTVVFRSPRAVMVRDPDGQLVEVLTMDYRRRLDAQR